jgi:hypothetical protein
MPPVRKPPYFPRVLTIPALFLALFLSSCGIEVYHYLPPVSSGSITTSANTYARIYLPGVSSPDFTHFALYYRIYISDQNRTGFSLSASDLQSINTSLYSDYNYLNNYTDTGSATTVNTASVMGNRSYQPLFFQLGPGSYSNTVLTAPGTTVELYFPPSGPYLRRSGVDLPLIRSNGGGAFDPRPDRLFTNKPDLYNPSYINANFNADVVAPSGPGSSRHAYAAIYIATAGINEQAGYVPIFSNPTLVGIFLLP